MFTVIYSVDTITVRERGRRAIEARTKVPSIIVSPFSSLFPLPSLSGALIAETGMMIRRGQIRWGLGWISRHLWHRSLINNIHQSESECGVGMCMAWQPGLAGGPGGCRFCP